MEVFLIKWDSALSERSTLHRESDFYHVSKNVFYQLNEIPAKQDVPTDINSLVFDQGFSE